MSNSMTNVGTKLWNIYRKKGFIIPSNIFVQFLVLSFGVFFLYAPTILNLIYSWRKNSDIYSHCFLIPVISLYLIWRRRSELQKMELSPNYWGSLFILFGGATLILGKVGNAFFLMHLSLIPVIVGLTLLLFGWRWLRALAFPIAYLIFMVPLPPFVLEVINPPLQLLAASFSNLFLRAFNISVFVDKNFIFLPDATLFVEPSCSGLRYILPVLAIAVLLAYLSLQRWSDRVVLVVIALTMAILTNVLRVASTGLLAHFVSPKLAEGSFHSFHGWLISIVNFVFLLGMISLLAKRNRTKEQPVEQEDSVPADSSSSTYRFPLIEYTKQFYFAVIILMSLAACFHLLSNRRMPLRKSLTEFPLIVGNWQGKDIKDVSDMPNVAHIDDSLARVYSDGSGYQVKFYVAYSQNQRQGAEVFRTPSEFFLDDWWAEWWLTEKESETLAVPGGKGKNVKVSRYVLQSDATKHFVLCWYQSGDKSMANLFQAKIRLVINALTQNRFDGAFVYICVPVIHSMELASARIRNFAELILPLLSNHLPG